MDEWSGNGRLRQSFPLLFALASDPECSLRHAWHNAWAPPMPAALSDQQTSELLRLQELLVDQRPTEVQDGWTWFEPSFSFRAAYRRLRAQAGSEDPLFLGLWRRIWRSRIPSKIRVFLWLLLQRRLMTRSLRQHLVSHSSAECAMCGAILKDCDHLFARCPFAQAVWTMTRVVRPRLSSMEDFWRSMADSPYRREGRVASHLRHALGHMEPPKRGRLQGSNPLRRCSSARSRGPGSLMEPSQLRPLGFCTPIDSFFVCSVINSMTTGGFHFEGPSFSFQKKK